MASEYALQKAAQAWCTSKTSGIEVDVRLAEAFAEIVDAEIAAERERWREPIAAMSDAVMDTMASGRPVAHLDSACALLVEMVKP